MISIRTMISYLFETKLLPEPVLTYGLKGQMSVKFEWKYKKIRQ